MKQPAVSVVITCYNYGRYLDGCLSSVLRQTYKDYEIVVIDDGSTDNTPELMRSYSCLPNLSYVRQANEGQVCAKNRGIELARGRYVAFLDADDLWEPQKLEKQIELFAGSQVGVAYSRARYIDEAGQPLSVSLGCRYLLPRRGRVADWLFLDNFVPFSSSMVRRECFESLGVFDERLPMGIDWDLWLRLSTQYEFDFVDEPLLAYRMGHAGQMSKNAPMRQQCADQIMTRFLERFPGAIEPKTIREAYSYTFCNRGSYFRRIDRKKSYGFFFRAIRQYPLNVDAYKGLVKNVLAWD